MSNLTSLLLSCLKRLRLAQNSTKLTGYKQIREHFKHFSLKILLRGAKVYRLKIWLSPRFVTFGANLGKMMSNLVCLCIMVRLLCLCIMADLQVECLICCHDTWPFQQWHVMWICCQFHYKMWLKINVSWYSLGEILL